MGLLLINQEVEGLLSSEAGKSVLANSAYTMFMRQKPAVINDVCNTFHLSNSERTHLLTANVGERILIMENDHTEIRIVALDEEHRIITTNADELIEQNKPKSKEQCTTKNKSRNAENAKPKKPVKHDMLTKKAKPRVSINVDGYKGFYRHRNLNLHEIKYLLVRKYRIIDRFSITSGKKEKFLIKPRFNESINHMFVVCDITEFLKSKGARIENLSQKTLTLLLKSMTKGKTNPN